MIRRSLFYTVPLIVIRVTKRGTILELTSAPQERNCGNNPYRVPKIAAAVHRICAAIQA